jgi:beta-glucosidase
VGIFRSCFIGCATTQRNATGSRLPLNIASPIKELKGFAKVNLKPGEKKRVRVTLNRRAFSFYEVNSKGWSAEPGEFSVLVGDSSVSVPLKATFTLTRQDRCHRR